MIDNDHWLVTPDLREAIEREIAETYDGTDHPRPTVDEVVSVALSDALDDVLRRIGELRECEGIDDCRAEALVLARLATWLK